MDWLGRDGGMRRRLVRFRRWRNLRLHHAGRAGERDRGEQHERE